MVPSITASCNAVFIAHYHVLLSLKKVFIKFNPRDKCTLLILLLSSGKKKSALVILVNAEICFHKSHQWAAAYSIISFEINKSYCYVTSRFATLYYYTHIQYSIRYSRPVILPIRIRQFQYSHTPNR